MYIPSMDGLDDPISDWKRQESLIQTLPKTSSARQVESDKVTHISFVFLKVDLTNERGSDRSAIRYIHRLCQIKNKIRNCRRHCEKPS